MARPATLDLAGLLGLLGHDGFTSVCHRVPGGQFRSRVVRWDEAAAAVPAGADVWYGVNPVAGPARENQGRGGAADVVRLVALHADLDVKAGGMPTTEAAADVVNDLAVMLGTRPAAVVLSGHGLQPYWPVEDGPGGPAGRALLRRWGRLVAHVASVRGGAVDPVYDLSRVLRVPGTTNLKDPDHPMPVVGAADTGRALSVEEVDEALTAYGAVEQPGDRDEPGAVVSAPGDWAWADTTCEYVRRMAVGWGNDTPAARHPWLLGQATRVAAAHRHGCLAQPDHRTVGGLLAARFRSLLVVPPTRKEGPGEIADAFGWGRELVAAMTDELVAAELGGHSHEPAVELTLTGAPPALKVVEGGGQAPAGATALQLRQDDSDLPARVSVTLTDHGNAQLLIGRYGGRLRYALNRGWLAWDGIRWRRCDDDSEAFRAAIETIHAIDPAASTALRAHRSRSLSKRALESMVGLARRDASIGVPADELDADPLTLCTPGGLIDLRTGTVGPNDPAHLNTKATGCAPSTEPPERWLRFLGETLPDDADLIAYVQRLAGYSATGLSDQHVLPFLHGAGGNGKGVFVEVLMGVLGDYATTAPAGFLMAGRDRHETEVARLDGTRLVVCSEINQRDRFDEAKVKLLTGGDRLTARFMNQNHFSFDPTHTLWLMGNHQPRVGAGGESFWRRLRLLPFTHVVPDSEKIPGLARQLVQAEGPGILGWLVEGAVAALRDGLREPAAVLAATETYAAEEDSLARFVVDRCLIGGGLIVRVATSEMRAAYEHWCRTEGEQPLPPQMFGRELRARHIGIARSNGRRFYTGVCLLELEDGQTLGMAPTDEPERSTEWWNK